MLGVSCTIYEREEYLNARSRDWNYGIYWAQSPLAECLPPNIREALKQAQVDPSHAPDEKDTLLLLHAETGETLMRIPTPYHVRYNRSKFRTTISDGVKIEVGRKEMDYLFITVDPQTLTGRHGTYI